MTTSPFFTDDSASNSSLAPVGGAQMLNSSERLADLVGRIAIALAGRDRQFAIQKFGERVAPGKPDPERDAAGRRVYDAIVEEAKSVIRGTGQPTSDRVRRETFLSALGGQFRVRLVDPSPHGMVTDGLMNKTTEANFVEGMLRACDEVCNQVARSEYNGEWKVLFVAPWRRTRASDTYHDRTTQAAAAIVESTIDDLDDGRLDRDSKATPQRIVQAAIGFTLVLVDVTGNRNLRREKGDVVGDNDNAVPYAQGPSAGDIGKAMGDALRDLLGQRAAPTPEADEADKFPGIPTHDENGVKIHHKTRERMWKDRGGE